MTLSEYVERLQGSGRYTLTRVEALKAIPVIPVAIVARGDSIESCPVDVPVIQSLSNSLARPRAARPQNRR